MKLNKVTNSQIAEIFIAAIRDGIAAEPTEGYTTNSGYTVFIEPDLHKVEALFNGKSELLLKFDDDNKTWDEATLGDWDSGFLELYEQVRKGKGLRVIR